MPTEGSIFAKADHAAPHMAWIEKVISLSIRHCQRVDSREVPQIAVWVSEVEYLLNASNENVIT